MSEKSNKQLAELQWARAAVEEAVKNGLSRAHHGGALHQFRGLVSTANANRYAYRMAEARPWQLGWRDQNTLALNYLLRFPEFQSWFDTVARREWFEGQQAAKALLVEEFRQHPDNKDLQTLSDSGRLAPTPLPVELQKNWPSAIEIVDEIIARVTPPEAEINAYKSQGRVDPNAGKKKG